MSTFKNGIFEKRVENTFVIWVYKLNRSRILNCVYSLLMSHRQQNRTK